MSHEVSITILGSEFSDNPEIADKWFNLNSVIGVPGSKPASQDEAIAFAKKHNGFRGPFNTVKEAERSAGSRSSSFSPNTSRDPTARELGTYGLQRFRKGAFELTLGSIGSLHDWFNEQVNKTRLGPYLGGPTDWRERMEADLRATGSDPYAPPPEGTEDSLLMKATGMGAEFVGMSAMPNAVYGRLAAKHLPQAAAATRSVLSRTFIEPIAKAPGRMAVADILGSIGAGAAGEVTKEFTDNIYAELAAQMLGGGVAALPALVRRAPAKARVPTAPRPPLDETLGKESALGAVVDSRLGARQAAEVDLPVLHEAPGAYVPVSNSPVDDLADLVPKRPVDLGEARHESRAAREAFEAADAAQLEQARRAAIERHAGTAEMLEPGVEHLPETGGPFAVRTADPTAARGAPSSAPAVALPGKPITNWQAGRIAEEMGGEAEIRKWAGNLNLERRNDPESIKRGLQELTAQHGGSEAFWAARRGYLGEAGAGRTAGDRTARVSKDEVIARSEKYVGEMLGMTPEEIADRRIAGRWLEEELAAADIGLHVANYEVELSRIAMDAGEPNGHVRYAEALTQQAAVSHHLSQNQAGVARALGMLRRDTTGAKKEIARRAILKKYGGEEGIENIAKHLDEIDDAAERAGIAKSMVDDASRGWGWNVAELWKAGLLTGPLTHKVNLWSNTLWTGIWHGFEQPVAAVAGLPGAAIRKVVGAEQRDRVFLQEAGAEVYGLLKAVPLALRTAYRSAIDDVEWDPLLRSNEYNKALLSKKRRNPLASGASRVAESSSQFDVAPTKGGKLWRVYPGGVFSLLRGEDAFYKDIANIARLHGLGMRDAIKNDIPFGPRRFEHVAKFVRTAPAAARKESAERAAWLTYTNDLGKVGKQLQSLANKAPWLTPILTFIKTPANVTLRAMERTPGLQLLMPSTWRDLKAGGIQRGRAIGRLATAGAVAAYYTNKINDGEITGPMPRDGAERDLFLSQGKMPYSELVERDGKMFMESYARNEPYATPLAFLATLMNWRNEGILSQEEWDRGAELAAMAISENVMSKSFLEGAANAMEAASDPQRNMGRYSQKLLASVIPSGINAYANAADVYRRDTMGLWDRYAETLGGRVPAVAARIAEWRENLPIRHDLVGRAMPAGDVRDSTLKRIFSDYLSEVRNHPILEAMAVTNARIRLQRPTVTISKDALWSMSDRDLIIDAQTLVAPLTVRLTPTEQEHVNRVGNSAAAEELMKYIPKLMKARKTMPFVTLAEMQRRDVPKAYTDKLRSEKIGRAATSDAIRSLIRNAYERHTAAAREQILNEWRENGKLREKLEKELTIQDNLERGRERFHALGTSRLGSVE